MDEKNAYTRCYKYIILIQISLETLGGFDQADIDRIKNRKKWLRLFLEYNDLHMKNSLNQLWETCIWRKKHNVNGEQIKVF